MGEPNVQESGRVVAPHFVAGLEMIDGKVIRAAPIIRYMVGWTRDEVRSYVERKGWTATRRVHDA